MQKSESDLARASALLRSLSDPVTHREIRSGTAAKSLAERGYAVPNRTTTTTTVRPVIQTVGQPTDADLLKALERQIDDLIRERDRLKAKEKPKDANNASLAP